MASLWDSFTGAAATSALKKGKKEAEGFLNTGLSNATGSINPYLQSGNQANALYGNYMGLNGQEAQQNAFSGFQTSPGYQALLDARMRGVNAQANRGGGYYSGANLRAAGDAHQSLMSQEFQQYLQRLGAMQGQGAQMGQYQAGMQYGHGQQMAGNAITSANAMAAAANAPMQNLIGLGSLGLAGYGAFMGAPQAKPAMPAGGFTPSQYGYPTANAMGAR